MVACCLILVNDRSYAQNCPAISFQPPLDQQLVVTPNGSFNPNRVIDGVVRPHYGIDLRANQPDIVRAMAKGKVIAAGLGAKPGTGWFVAIQHSGNVVTKYMHLVAHSTDGLTVGTEVLQGAQIGIADNTGCCNKGPHLHVEMALPSGKIDPFPCISTRRLLQDLWAFSVESCNIFGNCPTDPCIRGGRDYILEATLTETLPADASVEFFIDGRQIPTPTQPHAPFVDSDSFLGLPYKPEPGTILTARAVLKQPGYADETIEKNFTVMFDPQVVFAMGTWRVTIDHQRTKNALICDGCSSLTPPTEPCYTVSRYNGNGHFSGVLSHQFCRLLGTLEGSVQGNIRRRHYNKFSQFLSESQCAVTSQNVSCPVRGCMEINIRRNRVEISGGPPVSFSPGCPRDCFPGGDITGLPLDTYVPTGFDFDPFIEGDQVIGDAHVSVTWDGPDGAPRVLYTRSWQTGPFLDIFTDTGQTTILLERVPPGTPATSTPAAPIVPSVTADLERVPLPEMLRSIPNPAWNAASFEITVERPGIGKLFVYDVKGSLVRELPERHYPLGATRVDWDGKDNSGSSVAAGVYLLKLVVGDAVASAKVTLMR